MKRIRIVWKKLPKEWGLADHTKHTIWLDERMTDKTLIEIASHEVAHVVLPVLDESAVDLLGKHIADVLTRIGFRRIYEGEE